jgi:hypothetical protein
MQYKLQIQRFKKQSTITRNMRKATAKSFKIKLLNHVWWLTPVILATQEAEIRRIMV